MTVRENNPPTNPPPDANREAGLRCRKCSARRFRVIYTRGTRDGQIMRRRECRKCNTRVTTWEHSIGA